MNIRDCLLFILWVRIRGDVEVSCLFKKSCILPCSFQSSSDVVIHWILVAGSALVHSYYNNQDQLARQDQRFKHRTSLFKDQISSGNASIQLTEVKVQDEGTYICSTTDNDSLINLKVDVPVRKVDIQHAENRITCSSEGIYPKPEFTWSTRPPSNQTLQTSPTIQQTEQQLYNISSSLMVPDCITDLVYSCTVSTGRNQKRATLIRRPSIISFVSKTTISCTSTNKTQTELIWKFNHSQIILNRTNSNCFTVSKKWEQKVKSVSESGSLTLQDLSSDQGGTYTCELSDEEETNVTDTFLRIKSPGNSPSARGIAVGVVGAILIAIIGLLVYRKKKTAEGDVHTPMNTSSATNGKVGGSVPASTSVFEQDAGSQIALNAQKNVQMCVSVYHAQTPTGR